MQISSSARTSAVRSGVVTGLSTVAVSGASAIAGALLSRRFGHGALTDGFFAAYGVYIVVVLVASALRVVVLPRLARAALAGSIDRELGAWAIALLLVLGPVCAVAVLLPHEVASLLTSDPGARESAAALLPWLVLAAGAQVVAGLLASALAALDDYGTAAVGFGLGAIAGIAAIAALASRGIDAFGIGLALNGAIAVAVPTLGLIRRGVRPAVDRGALGRLAAVAVGVAVPAALQGLYVIGYRVSGGLGVGEPTTFSYAYLIASLLVAVTATSIALISSVPLTRGELSAERIRRHVVASSWLSLALIGAAGGVMALAGARIARLALGSSYGGSTGNELGDLVAYFAPWTVASVALSVAFPLLFVRGRAAWLPLLAVLALVVHVPVEWAGRELFGLPGIAVGMAVTTGVMLCVLLAALGSLGPSLIGIVHAGVFFGGLAGLCFGGVGLVLGGIPAAAAGFVLYVGALAVIRPRGLGSAISYLRTL